MTSRFPDGRRSPTGAPRTGPAQLEFWSRLAAFDGSLTQRWRSGRQRWRPAGELIAPHEYEVAAIADDRTAKQFVLDHHYSGTFPAARFRFGLYRKGALVGVAVFSVPMQPAVLACLPGDPAESVELGRFVLVDEVPGNGETWFLSRCFAALRREGLVGVVAFSDPVPRPTAAGELVFAGHVGTIYQAGSAVYLGRGSSAVKRLLPDGRVFSNRAASKVRRRERGWRYAAAVLEGYGATHLGEDEDAARWLRLWLSRLTRPLRHAGNHKYAWALERRARRLLPEGKPYPKQVDGSAKAQPWRGEDDGKPCSETDSRVRVGARATRPPAATGGEAVPQAGRRFGEGSALARGG